MSTMLQMGGGGGLGLIDARKRAHLSMSLLFRSPGGTPLRRLQEHHQPTTDDPAAIIAQALRRKFSHKVFQDSPGTCRN